MTHRPDILCIGSMHWDIIGRSPAVMALGADLPGRITRQTGGVALNIARTLAGLGLRPALLSAVGCDAEGAELIASATRMGVDCSYTHRSDDLPTDRYIALEAANGMIAAIADAALLEAAGKCILSPLADWRLGSATTPWAGQIAIDSNLGAELLDDIAVSVLFRAADLRLAAAGSGKAKRLMPLLALPNATLYLNLAEARLLGRNSFASAADAASGLIALGARRVLVTDGPRAAADGAAGADLNIAEPPPVPVIRVTGAGDTFMAAHITAERRGADRASALAAALEAAASYISGETGP